MSTVVDVILDKGEMLLKFDKSGTESIGYRKISKLRFSQTTLRKWLRQEIVQTIEVYRKVNDPPIIISSIEIKDFQKVEAYLRQVAPVYESPLEDLRAVI